jgi:hypothetical protein
LNRLNAVTSKRVDAATIRKRFRQQAEPCGSSHSVPEHRHPSPLSVRICLLRLGFRVWFRGSCRQSFA